MDVSTLPEASYNRLVGPISCEQNSPQDTRHVAFRPLKVSVTTPRVSASEPRRVLWESKRHLDGVKRYRARKTTVCRLGVDGIPGAGCQEADTPANKLCLMFAARSGGGR